MRYEWDEKKRRLNIEQHGIDFADLPPLFEGMTVILKDDRFDYGEIRFITLGWLNYQVLVVVHTETDEVIRIISARKATSYEERQYFEEIAE